MPQDPAPAEPNPQPDDAPVPAPHDQAEGVRRQRQHIQELDGEDPLRGGVAD